MKKTLKDYCIVLFGTGFSRGLAFLNSVIIARLLGPENFGKFSIFFVVMVLTWLFPQAFDSTFIRYAKTANSHSEKNEFLKISVFLKLVYSVIVLILVYPLAILLSEYCFHKPEVKMILVWAMFSGVLQSFLMTIASIFQEKERFTMFSFLYSFYTVSIFALLILIKLLNFEFSLNNVVVIHVLVSAIIGGTSLILLFKKKIKNLFPLNRGYLNTSFSLGKWIFGATIASYIFQRIDFFFLTRYANFDSLGIYAVSQQIIMVISVMTGSLTGVFLPKACKALESRYSFKTFRKESFLISGLINSLLVILMVIVPFVIRTLYGETYIMAAGITRILLIGWFASILYLPFSALYYALDDSKTRFLLEISKFFIVIVLFYILIPTKGIIGAAWAITLASIINSLVSLWILKNKIVYTFNANA